MVEPMIETLEPRLQMTAGALDTSFNATGILTKIYRNTNDFLDVVTQKNGMVVAVGDTQTTGQSKDGLIARFKPNGARDTSFGTDGSVIKNFGGEDVITSVAIQGDGKIVVAGTVSSTTTSIMLVARYLTTGQLDTSFGSGGIQTIDFIVNSGANGLAIQSDGKIVVSGFAGSGAFSVGLAVARLTTAGQLDTTFGQDHSGTFTTSSGKSLTTAEFCGRAVIQKDGKIITAMTTINLSKLAVLFGVARFTASGALDTTFSVDGRALATFGNKVEVATSVAIDPVSKYIVVGGTSADGILEFGTPVLSTLAAFAGATKADFAVARFKSGGGLDSTFSSDGRQTIGFKIGGAVTLDGATDIAVDSSERVYLTGASTLPGQLPDFSATRLTSSGALDTSFDGDGRRLYDIGGSDGSFGSFLTSAGKLWLAGHRKKVGEDGRAVLIEVLTA